MLMTRGINELFMGQYQYLTGCQVRWHLMESASNRRIKICIPKKRTRQPDLTRRTAAAQNALYIARCWTFPWFACELKTTRPEPTSMVVRGLGTTMPFPAGPKKTRCRPVAIGGVGAYHSSLIRLRVATCAALSARCEQKETRAGANYTNFARMFRVVFVEIARFHALMFHKTRHCR